MRCVWEVGVLKLADIHVMNNLGNSLMPLAQKQNAEIPTENDLLVRAKSLIPVLKERAKACEELRSVPQATIDDFREAGFFKIVQPIEYGGYGMSPLTLYRVLHEVGRGCMSSCWVLMVLALHSYEVYMMGKASCDEVWADDPDALVASSYAPLGKMEKVEGGYKLNGCWRFCSGIDHAQFVVVGGMVSIPGQERPDYRVCMVPASDFVINNDSWRAFGLAGTGSKDIQISDVFVSEDHSHSLIDAHLMLGQDKLPKQYRYPFWVAFGFCVASAVIGGTRGGLDELIEQMGARVGSFDMGAGRAPATQDPFVRARLGKATVLVRGAIARLEKVVFEMTDYIEQGEAIPVSDRLHYMAEAAQCGKDCEDAVLLLYKATGARGILLDNHMQSVFRNVMAGTNHISMHVEGMAINLGSSLLGAEDVSPIC